MPTIVGILTFMNKKNNILGLSEREQAKFFCCIFILISISNFNLVETASTLADGIYMDFYQI